MEYALNVAQPFEQFAYTSIAFELWLFHSCFMKNIIALLLKLNRAHRFDVIFNVQTNIDIETQFWETGCGRIDIVQMAFR